MAIRDVLVHLDQSERSKVRLLLAAHFAKQHNAKLIGLFAQKAAPARVGLSVMWPSEDYKTQAKLSSEEFAAATTDLAEAEWMDLNRGGDAALISGITEHARCVDLVVVGQNSPDKNGNVPEELIEELVINSGTPVLTIPYAGDFGEGFKHAIIAWNNSREAVHAIRDSLSILQGCQDVEIISLDSNGSNGSSESIASHLMRHGVRTSAEEVQVRDIGVMDMLLNRVSDSGADLLIMGGHGHIGFPFFSQGAGTRHILKTMTVPVLMSN